MDDYASTSSSNPRLANPVPRRPANLSLQPLTTTTSHDSPSEPPSAGTDSDYLNISLSNNSRRSSGVNLASNGAATPSNLNSASRNRSIMNLTASTLFGIYSPTGYDANRDGLETPFGTGAQTPAPRQSVDGGSAGFFNGDLRRSLNSLSQQQQQQQGRPKARAPSHTARASPFTRRSTPLGVALRSALLLGIGLAYAALVSHFHDTRRLAPVRVERLDRSDWRYYAFWAVVAVVLGNAMPGVDRAWEGYVEGEDRYATFEEEEEREKDHAGDWIGVFRTIGAFVGIAFAIRRLPWTSTLQLSATLALINPALWYLLDRTLVGLALSATVGILGAGTVLGINPALVPRPTTHSIPTAYGGNLLGGLLTYETVGVVTWIGSVLFCACVCFGNIGRRVGL